MNINLDYEHLQMLHSGLLSVIVNIWIFNWNWSLILKDDYEEVSSISASVSGSEV